MTSKSARKRGSTRIETREAADALREISAKMDKVQSQSSYPQSMWAALSGSLGEVADVLSPKKKLGEADNKAHMAHAMERLMKGIRRAAVGVDRPAGQGNEDLLKHASVTLMKAAQYADDPALAEALKATSYALKGKALSMTLEMEVAGLLRLSEKGRKRDGGATGLYKLDASAYLLHDMAVDSLSKATTKLSKLVSMLRREESGQ